MCGRQAFGGEKRAVQMDREHLLPLGEGELLDRMHDLDAGIADEDVDAAERIDCRRHAHVDKVFTGDIHRNADGLAAELANLVGRDVRHRLVEVGDSNLGAFARGRVRSLFRHDHEPEVQRSAQAGEKLVEPERHWIKERVHTVF